MADEIIHEHDAIHTAFGLTYANYLVMHRTLLQSMPDEWQIKFVAMIDEYNAAFEHVDQPEVFEVFTGTDHYVNELTPAQLKTIGITVDERWSEDGDEYHGTTYSNARGDEVDGHEHVVLRCPDPVPHYNRGRAHVEPRFPEEDSSD